MRKLGKFMVGSIWSRFSWITAVAVVLGMWAEGTRTNVAHAAPPLTIGFIYVGPKTDYGYNQAHAQGAAALAKLPGVKIREEEMVPETVAVQKTMESMINLRRGGAAVPDLVRIFRPAHPEGGGEVQERHLPALRRPLHGGQAPDERRQLLRLHRRGAVRRRRRRRPDQQERQARLHRRQADPAGAAQHQLVHAGRALGEPEGHHHASSSPATGRCRSRKPRPPTA